MASRDSGENGAYSAGLDRSLKLFRPLRKIERQRAIQGLVAYLDSMASKFVSSRGVEVNRLRLRSM